MCDLDLAAVPPNHSVVAGHDLDTEVEAANRASRRDFFLDPSSSTLSGRAAAANRVAAAWYDLDKQAGATNRAVWRDFFLYPAIAARASSSTSGGQWRRARLPQPRSGNGDTSPS